MSDSSASPDNSPGKGQFNGKATEPVTNLEIERGSGAGPTIDVNINQSPQRAGAAAGPRVDVNVNILKSREADEELSVKLQYLKNQREREEMAEATRAAEAQPQGGVGSLSSVSLGALAPASSSSQSLGAPNERTLGDSETDEEKRKREAEERRRQFLADLEDDSDDDDDIVDLVNISM